MRITFSAVTREVMADLAQAAGRMSDRQLEVSSGRRVERPSDDPAAARRIVQEGAEMGTLDQYIRASDSVGARLTVADSVMADMLEHITQARAGASGAKGSHVTPAQREAIANSLNAHRDALFDSFTTRFRGAYLFAGAASSTSPYTQGPGGTVSAYAGSTTTVAVDIDRTRSVEVGFNGDSIARGTDVDDVFTVFEDLATAVQAGDGAGIDAGLLALERAFDRINMAQSRIGASLTTVDNAREGLEDQRRASAERLSRARDTNLPEAITAMAEADTAYRAALGATANVTRISLMDFLR